MSVDSVMQVEFGMYHKIKWVIENFNMCARNQFIKPRFIDCV